MPNVEALVFGAFGLIIGSFINVAVLRFGTGRSLSGRSACMSCGYQLRWFDLVPVFSWIFLRGRCRRCGSRIAVQYPLVELTTGFLFAYIGAAELPLFERAYVCVAAGLLVAIAVYDMRHTIIPDAWVYAFSVLGLGYALFADGPVLLRLAAGPIAALPLLSLWAFSRGRWMGLGDAKLALGMGWFLGPAAGLISIFFAFIIGAFISVGILLPLPYALSFLGRLGITALRTRPTRFTMQSEVPFGPFLVASFFIVWYAHVHDIALPLFR